MERNSQCRSAARAPRVVEASGGAIIEPMKVSIRPSTEKDLFDRYQMRQLVIRPAGGRTELLNLSDVAHDLHTRPEYLLASFSYELGVPKHEHTVKDYASLKGRHKTATLEDILVRFATEICLCSSCNLPETELLKNSQDKLQKRCASCGAVAALTTRNPKLGKFISTHYTPVHNLVALTSDLPPRGKENIILDDASDDDDWGLSTDPAAVKARRDAQKQH